MKNFLRSLRYCAPHRYRLALSIFCALCAAILWGLNFTAIYPVLRILGNDQNMQEWVEERIKLTVKGPPNEPGKGIDSLQEEADQLSLQEQEIDGFRPATEDEQAFKEQRKRDLAARHAKVEAQLNAARVQLYRLQIAKKYITLCCPAGRFETLALVIGLVVLAVAIKGVFEFGQESLVGSVVNLSLFDLRNRFYRNTIHLDVSSFSDQGTSDLMARFTNDLEVVGTGQKTLFGKLIAEPLRALSCVVFACWISWQLTLMFLILVPIAAFILTKVGQLMKRATRRLLERMSSIYKILQESFRGIKVVKAFTMEPYERRRFRNATKDYYHKAMMVVNIDAAASPIIEWLGVTAVALALLAGAYLVLENKQILGLRLSSQPLDAASLLQLYALLAAIADPVRKMSSVYTKLQSGWAAADRVFAFLDRQPRVGRNSNSPRLARHHCSIEFRDVCFSYQPEKPILTNVNLRFRAGETIAVVGKNGTGKTTLLGLIPRFYDPDHGAILIDGYDIRTMNLRSLRQQIGIVTQDSILFDDTIYNNISYGNRRAGKEDVEAAARNALAHDFIMEKPEGYQYRVGEAGGQLSGGQKQRIALARAILRDPSILILDEFTSQSDTVNEAELHRVLKEFMSSRTTFVITHRLNTLEIADRIVVLDNSRVAAIGTHAELLATCPAYQLLHEAQFRRLSA